MNKAAACAVGGFCPILRSTETPLTTRFGYTNPICIKSRKRIVHGDLPTCHDERTDMSARLLVDEIVMGAAQVSSAAMCLIVIKGGAYEENRIHFDVVRCLFAGIDRLSSGGDR